MPADLTPDTEATMTTTEPRPPSTLSRDGCIDEIRRLEAEVEVVTTERDEARFNLSEKRRTLKAICDFLHPDGGGPENPAGCDVQGYVIMDITSLRERLSLTQQSDRAMAMRAERAERERDEARAEVERLRSDLAAIWTTCTGIVSTAADGPDADNIPRRVEELRALAIQPMDGPPTEPGWYVMLDEDDRRHVVQVYGPPGTTLCVDHGGWGWHTVDAAPTGLLWLARIPVEALEVSDGE